MCELSVIVPVYNVEKFLPRCIDSILNQTLKDLELILIDDGSTDSSGKICDEYARKDKRIRVIHQKNSGVSVARNAGLELVTGKYVSFIDSDDFIDPQMYKVMLSVAYEKLVDVVGCGTLMHNISNNEVRKMLCRNYSYDSEQLLNTLFEMPNPWGGGCCNKIFLYEKIYGIRFSTDIKIGEDWLFLFDCFCKSNSGEQIENAYYHVLEREGSATRGNRNVLAVNAIKSSQLLLYKAKNYSVKLEEKAINKFLDDCLRYGALLKNTIGNRYYVKWIMLKELLGAFQKKIISNAKVRGYLIEMLKL